MNARLVLSVAAIGYLLLICLNAEANPRIDGELYASENEINPKEDVEERINLGEPIKTLVQTGTRFMLAQTELTNHLNIDTAMDIINNLGYMLSRPSTLIKVVEVAAVSIVGLLSATFFFPGFYNYLEAAWKNPVATLNLDKFMSNGISERSVLGLLGTTTDQALSRVGLEEGSCREKSICYVGEIIRCTFPETSQTVARWASDNFSKSSYLENTYFKAFKNGFVDKNCTKVAASSDPNESRCLGNLINGIMNPRTFRAAKKFQSIQPVARA